MSNKVRWGVLSTAQIARNNVVPAMQAGAFTEVVAIASRDESRAHAAAAELGIPRAYGSYEAMLADPEIDAIYNPLPNHLHAALTIKALEAGKHVLCEKPIALDAEEARRIEEAQKKSGLLVGEAFMVRFHPQWRRAREIVREGRLGEVRAIQTIFSYFLTDPGNIRNQADIGGGGLYDIGCYAIATARFMFEAEPERVIGILDVDPRLGTDRLSSGLAVFPEGRQLAFTCATQLVPCQRVQILGTQGRIEIQIPFNAPASMEATIVIDDGRDLSGSGREHVTIPPADQYTLQGDAFSQAILGEQPLEWGVGDAVSNMRVIDALFRSAGSGQWERP
ncbi:Gfo/Idh/MocA family protein [Microvirga lotononidis]|uniref:Putative dehydrogenase n=1 Tax=Microvirga lotononidis TaxID=864069 RepID=I4YPH2_9HYPH|nr:Gfo/Idh/MocA family oxidoreductase [Microvirga lotononidis]EIM25864.1 putative dehydrogenase [Microvirga lotononidis]WQO25784.1 Gfo/Idh/MocA family oxidoreductase [Microvirga lotononidis]